MAMLYSTMITINLCVRYLQAYLNIAFDKVAELKQEAGKISNLELQRKVVRLGWAIINIRCLVG